jgi:hypothetical protein
MVLGTSTLGPVRVDFFWRVLYLYIGSKIALTTRNDLLMNKQPNSHRYRTTRPSASLLPKVELLVSTHALDRSIDQFRQS